MLSYIYTTSDRLSNDIEFNPHIYLSLCFFKHLVNIVAFAHIYISLYMSLKLDFIVYLL